MRPTKLSLATRLFAGALALIAGARSSSAQTAIVLEVDGTSAAYLSSFQAPSYEVEDVSQSLGPDHAPPARKMIGQPKIGEATAVFNISQAGALLNWVTNAMEGRSALLDTAVSLVDPNYNIKRGIDMGACVITGIEWPELQASDGKKHFEVTAKWQPQNIKYVGGGSGKPQSLPAPPSADALTSTFIVTTPGLKSEWITSVGLPKITPKIAKESHGKFRLPLLNYASIEFASLTLGITQDGFEAARSMASRVLQDGRCDGAETQEIAIALKDGARGPVGTFTAVGCLKKFDWAPKLEGGKEGLATATMEFMVEDFRYKVDHK